MSGRERVVIVDPEGRPTINEANVARSVQAADVRLSPEQVAALWSPGGLARLAGSYWRFLGRVSVGLIGVRATATTRSIVLGARPLVLLSFDAPTYVIDGSNARVRWPIRGGLLLARSKRPSRGSLEISVRTLGPLAAATPAATVRVEVAVCDFVPSIAEVFGPRVYAATQSKLHVAVSHGFLRSLARLDLNRPPPESKLRSDSRARGQARTRTP